MEDTHIARQAWCREGFIERRATRHVALTRSETILREGSAQSALKRGECHDVMLSKLVQMPQQLARANERRAITARGDAFQHAPRRLCCRWAIIARQRPQGARAIGFNKFAQFALDFSGHGLVLSGL